MFLTILLLVLTCIIKLSKTLGSFYCTFSSSHSTRKHLEQSGTDTMGLPIGHSQHSRQVIESLKLLSLFNTSNAVNKLDSNDE